MFHVTPASAPQQQPQQQSYSSGATPTSSFHRGARRPRVGHGSPDHYDASEDFFIPRSKLPGQRPIDLFTPAIQHVQRRLEHHRTPYRYHVPPHEFYAKDVLPVRNTQENPSTALCTQWANTSFHPDSRQMRSTRVPLYGMQWAPHGNRLLCTTSRGEFVMFNGKSFGVEVKTMAHEDGRPCRALAWGPRSDLIASGSDTGKLKLWMSNLVVLAEIDSHHRAVRDLSWSPLENKLVSCGQDGSARLWDVPRLLFASSSSSSITTGEQSSSPTGGAGPDTASHPAPSNNTKNHHHHHSSSSTGGAAAAAAAEECRLEGHGGEVTAVEWHPYQALIATGSQDTQVRLWDPRSAAAGSLLVLQGHSQSVTAVRWHPSDSHTLLTAGKDSVVRLWDIRRPACERMRFTRHTKAVEQVRWHPHCPDLFASTGEDGSLVYWAVEEGDGVKIAPHTMEAIHEAARVEAAHDRFKGTPNPVHNIAWSPQGHLLASCGTEVKYWTRNKPGAREERERGGGGGGLGDDDDDDVLGVDSSTQAMMPPPPPPPPL